MSRWMREEKVDSENAERVSGRGSSIQNQANRNRKPMESGGRKEFTKDPKMYGASRFQKLHMIKGLESEDDDSVVEEDDEPDAFNLLATFANGRGAQHDRVFDATHKIGKLEKLDGTRLVMDVSSSY